MNISPFVLEQVFHRIDTDDGPVWWRQAKEPNEGYIVFWETEHLHTYFYPPGVWGNHA